MTTDVREQAIKISTALIEDSFKFQEIVKAYRRGFLSDGNDDEMNRTLEESKKVWEEALANPDFNKWFTKAEELMDLLNTVDVPEATDERIAGVQNKAVKPVLDSVDTDLLKDHELAVYLVRKCLMHNVPMGECSSWRKFTKNYTDLVMNNVPVRR